MKTFRMIGTALLASAFCFGFSSCSSDDVDETANPLSVYDSAIGKILDAAKTDIPLTQILVKDANSPISKIKLGEGNTFLTELKATRASSNVITGTYTIEGSDVVLKIGKYTVKVPVSKVVETALRIAVNGTEYDAEAFKVGGTANAQTLSICRAWVPVDYHAVIVADGKVMYNKHNSDLVALQRDFYAYVLGLPSQNDVRESDLLISHNVKSFTFMSDNTFVSTYTNEQSDVNNWSWSDGSKGKIRFNIAENDINGEARFEKGNPNTLYLLSDVDLSAVSNLKDYKITAKIVITMNDKK